VFSVCSVQGLDYVVGFRSSTQPTGLVYFLGFVLLLVFVPGLVLGLGLCLCSVCGLCRVWFMLLGFVLLLIFVPDSILPVPSPKSA